MKKQKDEFELVHGSGNVFRDHGDPDADVQQMKAILAARIIEILDEQGLSVRAAHKKTGIAAADFSRIRNADLGRFSVDRLVRVINRLDDTTEVTVQLLPEARADGSINLAHPKVGGYQEHDTSGSGSY